MTTRDRQVQSSSPDDTQTIAATLAPLLQAGDCVLLDGPIGAGKSHFARSAILKLLPSPEEIPSPTYTLVQTYIAQSTEIWHADLYRLSDPGEIHELGLTTAFDYAICFVEWPDRLGEATPQSSLRIRFAEHDTEQSRLLQFSWSDARWDVRLKEIFCD